jgi:ketosteroid isomerase-like protein
LTVDTSGGTDDSFSVTFKSLDAGRQMRVTRRITAPQLNEPIIVESVYNRISTVARWDIYGEPGNKPVASSVAGSTGAGTPPTNTANPEVATLRTALNEWLQATNSRDVSKLISFYAPEIKAFYLKRNVSRAFVQSERSRTFHELSTITVSAEEPEVIFAGSEVAVMRFRKQYMTVRSGRTKQGTVIEELRWRKTGDGWKIFSERDVRVIR